MRKRIKLLLTLSLFILFAVVLGYRTFSSYTANSTENINSANKLANMGVIVDHSSDTSLYNLGDSITRREMLKVMMNISGEKVSEKCEGKFVDLNRDDWGCKYAEIALSLGYIASNSEFRPDDKVSKIETLKMIFKAKGIEREENDDWRRGYVNTAVNLGISEIFSDYNNSSRRWWVFVRADKTIAKSNGNQSLVCEDVDTFAINNDSGECFSFKSSCIPEGWYGVDKCDGEKISLEKDFFEISFAENMDKGSVEENLKMYPQVLSNYVWQDSKTLKVEINQELDKETDFLVNISADTKLENGETLKGDIVKKFKVSGVTKIDFVSPEGEIKDLTKNITVRFSKPVVPLTTLDTASICPIVITPSLPGKCVWITTSTFQFRPGNGFPIGGKYDVNINSGFKTIYGDKTNDSKRFTISTPKFEVINSGTKINKDDKLLVTFNSEISIENFKENFSISGYTNDALTIEHLSHTPPGGLRETRKNIVSIFPKLSDWGYNKNYNYTLKSGLKSSRGNVPIGTEKKKNLQINKLLTNYKPFLYRDTETENKELISNLKTSADSSTITKKGANILLSFHEEIGLDKSIIKVNNFSYNLKYAKKSNYIDGENKIEENKKEIIVEIPNFKANSNVTSALIINILASKISNSDDIKLSFNTKQENKVISYKMIDYKQACLKLKSSIGYDRINYDYFKYSPDSNLSYISEVGKYSRNDECTYELGVFTYLLNTRLNPDSNYKLTIEDKVLDTHNYNLDKSYDFSFKTNLAMNEDKRVNVIDNRELILVPKDLSPLGIGITTINLDKVVVEVCEGDFNITSEDYMENTSCKSKEININNLGFKPNISVINLESILETDISKSIVSLKVTKKEIDKTDYEKTNNNNYYGNRKVHFIISDKSVVLKTNGEDSSLWLSDTKTGESLSNQISKISHYKTENNYSLFGKYKGKKTSYEGDIEFSSIGDGLYNLDSDIETGLLLISLTNGEKVLLSTLRLYADNNGGNARIYLSTDAPLYKPGNTVNIKGTSRELNPTNYNVGKGSINLSIRDSRYKTIVQNTSVKLDNNGAFTYSYTIDKEASLGNYTIIVSSDNGGGSLNFTVEEFEKPDFKVESSSKKDVYLYSEVPDVEVNAEYYVGSKLGGAKGIYSVYSKDYYFDGGKTTGYIWGENSSYYWWDNSRNSSDNNTINNVAFNLDNNGKAILKIDTSKTTKDKVYTINSTVTDPNTQKAISTNSNFKVINSPIFVGMKFNKYYYNFGDTSKIDFVTTDIDGNKKPNQSLKFKVYKIDYEYDKNTYRVDKKEILVKESSVSTNGNAISTIDYKFSDYGEYKIEISLSNGKYLTSKTLYVSGYNLLRPDDADHSLTILKSKEKYSIGDEAEVIIQSPVTGAKALVTIEKLGSVLHKKIIDIDSNSQSYKFKVKEEYLPNVELKAFIIKNSSIETKTWDKLKDIRAEMLEIENTLNENRDDIIVPYPIYFDYVYEKGIVSPIYRDDTSLDKDLLEKLASLRVDEQKIMQDILPKYYDGKSDIKIKLESIKLNSTVSIDKVSYLPGDRQEITLNIKDNNGNYVNGDALISIVDESLLALKNNDVDIIDFFYKDTYNNTISVYNLNDLIKRFDFQKEKEEEMDDSDGGSFNISSDSIMMGAVSEAMDMEESAPRAMTKSDGGGIGSSSSGGESNATRLRTDFKDLAHYKGIVNVVNGKATIIVPKLPDNLTTWLIKGYTITKDTKVGSFSKDFKVQKELNLLPSIPRFFTMGDEAEISTIVVNNSPNDIYTTNTLDATNLEIIGASEVKKLVSANTQELVSFKVKVKNKPNDIVWNSYNSTINIKSVAGDLVDSLQLDKKIIPYSTPEYSFTNGSTYDLSYEEKIFLPNSVDKDFGQVDITIGASILTNLLDSIENIASSPMNNFYSTVSAFKKAATLRGLYKAAGEEDKYFEIVVVDYLGEEHKLHDLITKRINDIAGYQNTDGGMMYYDECRIYYGKNTCSNLDLTGEFLSTARKMNQNGYSVSESITSKALAYYKKTLDEVIADSERRGSVYRDIDSFYKILGYDKSYLEKYLLSDRFKENSTYEFDNISKLKIILILQDLGKNNGSLSKYIKDISNSTLIEARGTLVPANNWSRNNSISTSLALKMFINELEGEKLIIENFARWLVSQKDESGNFGSHYDSAEILEAITSYIKYTKELENIDFTGKGFLNSKEIISSTFNDDNKFENLSKSFEIKDYINIGKFNSLGFEKTGNGKLYYDVGLRYYLPIEEIAPRDEGIIVNRRYYNYEQYKEAFVKDCYYPYWGDEVYFRGYSSYYHPCTTKKVKAISEVSYGAKGDYLVGQIEIIVPHERNNVIINNFIPAGAEIVNTNLDTTNEDIKDIEGQDKNGWWGGFEHIDNKDEKIVLFSSKLYKGSYTYNYVIKLNHKGTYHHRPAVAEGMKKPEIWGRSKGEFFEIK